LSETLSRRNLQGQLLKRMNWRSSVPQRPVTDILRSRAIPPEMDLFPPRVHQCLSGLHCPLRNRISFTLLVLNLHMAIVVILHKDRMMMTLTKRTKMITNSLSGLESSERDLMVPEVGAGKISIGDLVKLVLEMNL